MVGSEAFTKLIMQLGPCKFWAGLAAFIDSKYCRWNGCLYSPDWTGLDWTGVEWTGLEDQSLWHIGDVFPVTPMHAKLITSDRQQALVM